MNRNKQLEINMVAQIIAFIVSLGISFLLTPFIVNNVSSEAYGFVGLSNNFVSYAELVTIALNSMAGRFITIKIHQNDKIGANKYFTSVVFANIVLAFIVAILSLIIVLFLDKLVNIPSEILIDAKLLFALMFLNFIISIISGIFGVAVFATNKLYLSSIRNIAAQIIRVGILVIAYSAFKPAVWYLGLSACICTTYNLIWNIRYTKILLPDIEVKRKYFDSKSILEIISSGIWNTITKLSQILTSGLDLLITNLLINSAMMGILSIAKTVPTAITSLIVTVASVFSPSMTIAYAKNNKNELVNQINQAMKIMTIFTVIPNAVLVCFGKEFYRLWIPQENIDLIYTLSVLSILNSVVSGVIYPLYNVFTITNKVKINSIVMILYGVISTTTTFTVLKFTDLGVYAIAGVSTGYALILPFIFHIPYAAKYLDLKWYSFYNVALKSILCFSLLTILGMGINKLVFIDSWISLIFICMIYSVLALVLLLFIFLNKSERIILIKKLKR